MRESTYASPLARIVTLSLAMLLAPGCGGGGADPDVKPVVFWHSMAGDLGKAMNVIVEKFNETHPRTPIRPVYQGGYEMLSQKIRTSVVAGQPPAMAQMYEAWTAYLNRDAGQEAVLDLTPFVAQPDFDRKDIFPVLLADGTFDGQVLALPFNKSFPVLYYNKDLFAEAGLDPERPPRSWQEFAEYGSKLTRDLDGDGRPDRWGWSFTPDAWLYLCMVKQFGGEYLSQDESRALFDRSEAVEALQFWVDSTRGPGRFAYKSTEFEPQNEYVAGNVAMVMSSSVSKSFMKPLIRFDMGMAPIPQGKVPAAIVSGTNVGIFRKAAPEQQRAAWDFLKFFTSTENTTYWAIKTNYIPVRKSALESSTWKKWVELDPTAAVAISQMEHASYEPRFPEWVDCRKILNQAISDAVQEGGGAANHLRRANDEINARLARRLGRG